MDSINMIRYKDKTTHGRVVMYVGRCECRGSYVTRRPEKVLVKFKVKVRDRGILLEGDLFKNGLKVDVNGRVDISVEETSEFYPELGFHIVSKKMGIDRRCRFKGHRVI